MPRCGPCSAGGFLSAGGAPSVNRGDGASAWVTGSEPCGPEAPRPCRVRGTGTGGGHFFHVQPLCLCSLVLDGRRVTGETGRPAGPRSGPELSCPVSVSNDADTQGWESVGRRPWGSDGRASRPAKPPPASRRSEKEAFARRPRLSPVVCARAPAGLGGHRAGHLGRPPCLLDFTDGTASPPGGSVPAGGALFRSRAWNVALSPA